MDNFLKLFCVYKSLISFKLSLKYSKDAKLSLLLLFDNNNSALANKLSRNCFLKVKQNFSWNKNASSYLKVI